MHERLIKTGIFLVTLSFINLFGVCAWAKPGNGNGGGDAGGGSGGTDELVYLASDDYGLVATEIESTSLNFTDIIFRQVVLDLSAFTVGGADWLPGNFGITQGTMVIGPNPELANHDSEMKFWFTAPLNGKNTQYYLSMYGNLAGDWFPVAGSVMTFDNWELMAENRKARKTGCYGSSFTDPLPDISILVEQAPAP